MKRRFLSLLVVAALLATLPAWPSFFGSRAEVSAQAAQAPQPAQEPDSQPPLTFRVEANFVEVDAIVSDAMGKPVTDLRADDFQLFEDGKPQKVSAFSHVNIPVTHLERPLFSPTAIEPDVHTNVGIDGRIYLVVLDDLHVDFTRTSQVRLSLHRFFERNFGANDLAAVVFTSGRADDGQDFTNNVRLLLAAVDKFAGHAPRSPTLERLDDYTRQTAGGLRQQGAPVADPLAMQRVQDARNSMKSVEKLSDFMAGLHGRRKAMVLVSEGIDVDIYNLFDNPQSSDVVDATRAAVAAATRANVSIYAIDPRGLAVAGSDLIETSGNASAEPELGLGIQSAQNELRLSQDSLRSLADDTGGFAVVNQNDVNSAFDRLVQDNSSYYVLGYYPANDKRDGKFRKIEVRLARPGLMIRSRRGYVAPSGKPPAPVKAAADAPSDALRAAVESPLPMGGIPMRLFAAAYKGTAPNATITIATELGIGSFMFAQQKGTYNDTLDVVVRVIDNAARVRINEKATVDLTLMPETFARAQARGFRVTSAVNLPPGRYTLRVSAADKGGSAGSVVGDLDVPDFYKQPLAMSGLTLISAQGALTPTARAKDDPVSTLLMRAPTTTREFTRDDQLALFAEVYENQQNQNLPPHKVDIATEVRAEGGRVVFSNSEERSSTELKGGRGGYGYTVQIPLTDLAPGLYVVHVQGKSLAGKADSGVARDIQIRIR